MSVFHMQHGNASASSNQLRPVSQDSEFDALCLELIGDIAAFRPGSKIVLVEGGGSEFDKGMIEKLFPEHTTVLNLISAGSKSRVLEVHRTLEQMQKHGQMREGVYSIVDRDLDVWNAKAPAKNRRFQWDVYHIENYLLEPRYIARAIEDLTLARDGSLSNHLIEDALRDIAHGKIENIAHAAVQDRLRSELVASIGLRKRGSESPIDYTGLSSEVLRAVEAVRKKGEEFSTAGAISAEVDKERERLDQALTDGRWKACFNGRDLLRALCGRFAGGIRYEIVRDNVVARMALEGHRPDGMEAVLREIIAG